MRRRVSGLISILIGSVWIGSGCGVDEGWEATIEGAEKPRAVLEQVRREQAEASRRLGEPQPSPDKTVLFGDLHVHTTYSWDGFLYSLPFVGGEGAHPPADACDFARYCADLDFFALTDHAESTGAEHWRASKESIRRCNAVAGDPADPDLVAFMGFEWSQAGLEPEDHYGHRCVFFPGTADDQLPPRPISSMDRTSSFTGMQKTARFIRWIQPHAWADYNGYVDYLANLAGRPVCPVDGGSAPENCQEVAPTPADLHARLDATGLEAMEIPHGTAWGIYTPVSATIEKHLDPEQFDPRRQRLIEIMSGHGNSEEYRGWRSVEVAADGTRVCPEPTPEFLPCCWQAGEIMRERCGDLPEAECEARVREARRLAAEVELRPQQVFPDAEMEDWLDCGQCRDCFKPAYGLRPTESVQYAMSLSNPDATDGDGAPSRFRYGFVGSSDIHNARPGPGYKQIERTMMTDSHPGGGWLLDQVTGWMRPRPEDPQRPIPPARGQQVGLTGNDMRVSSFMFAGGLAAVHAEGRNREAVWDALRRREVYATSGPRILLWFDLLNEDGGRSPMGSENVLDHNPVFEVRAAGSFEQKPGCPDWARQGLSEERLGWLCRDECYHPGDRRRRIESIEVVRIRPRVESGEAVGPRIEDPWKTFECPAEGNGCSVRFEDPDFAASGRDALYYVRALEQPSPAINGAPLQTQFEANGDAISIRPCERAEATDDCLGDAPERAWSSPIFIDQPR